MVSSNLQAVELVVMRQWHHAQGMVMADDQLLRMGSGCDRGAQKIWGSSSQRGVDKMAK